MTIKSTGFGIFSGYDRDENDLPYRQRRGEGEKRDSGKWCAVCKARGHYSWLDFTGLGGRGWFAACPRCGAEQENVK